MECFKGLNGTLILYDDHISIIRNGFLATTFHKLDEIQIFYCDISSVTFYPGSLVNGYICIEKKETKSPTNIVNAIKNDYTIIFRFTKNEQAKKIKRHIEEKKFLYYTEGGIK